MPRLPISLYALGLNALLLAAALSPLWGEKIFWVAAAFLAAAGGLAFSKGRVIFEKLDAALGRRDRLKNVLLAGSSLLVTFAVVELAAASLVWLGLAEPYSAMRTLVEDGDDWRLAHITADRYREADPVLLWRPVAAWPYTEQRFKGPVIASQKPAGTFRIFCYGDSNTDGPPRGGWPERLGERLAPDPSGETTIEVVNAGVAGYSSHQGLARFRQEAATTKPDLVLISFGWNDAVAVATPDKAYRPPPPGQVALERILLSYRFYRVGRFYLRPRKELDEHEPVPRVSRRDYIANLKEFRRQARKRGAQTVFLTRPHKAEVASALDWRGQVPSYNLALLRFSERRSRTAFDVEGHFAKRPDLFADNSHFTREGHIAMAEFLHRALEEAGLLPPGTSNFPGS